MARESPLKAIAVLLDTIGGSAGLDTTTGNHFTFAGTSLCNLLHFRLENTKAFPLVTCLSFGGNFGVTWW